MKKRTKHIEGQNDGHCNLTIQSNVHIVAVDLCVKETNVQILVTTIIIKLFICYQKLHYSYKDNEEEEA